MTQLNKRLGLIATLALLPGLAQAHPGHDGVLGIFRPKTTKCSGGRAVRGLQRGITFR